MYKLILLKDNEELQNWEVSLKIPETFGWNLSLELGKVGLVNDIIQVLKDDQNAT